MAFPRVALKAHLDRSDEALAKQTAAHEKVEARLAAVVNPPDLGMSKGKIDTCIEKGVHPCS